VNATATTIVTGATGGIGAAMSRAYLREGHNVVLSGRDARKLDALTHSLNAPDRVVSVIGDLRDPRVARVLVDTAVDRFGPTLKNLINNAGTFLVKPFLETTDEDMQPYLDLFKGTYQLTRMAASQIRRQAESTGSTRDNGSVIFISTIFTQGFISQFPCSAVGAIKAAYSGFARNACYELATLGIRVNTLDLGIVETPIYGLDEAGLATLRNMQPLRINGRPENVADATTFLTERSPFTTGQVIAIDGGASAGHYTPSIAE